MRKIWILISLLLSVSLTGCNDFAKSNSGRNQNMANMEESINALEQFYKLVEEDKTGDKKSVYWDGKSASMVEDEFDSLDISDGRGGITGTERTGIPDVFELYYPDSIENVVLTSDSEEDYHLTTDVVDIRIQLVDFHSKQEELKEDSSYKEIDGGILSKHQTKYFENYKLYVGLIKTGEETYAGYTLLFQSNLNDKSYMISVAGIGNLEDIKINALYIMNHFDVSY